MAYVDGFVIPIAKKQVPAYQKIARKAGKVWMEYGALAYYETLGDDLTIAGVGSFLEQYQCQKGETVVFAFIVFKSKAHRDRVNKQVLADPRLTHACPFDVKRMNYGGFRSLVVLDKPRKPAARAKRQK